MSTIVVERNDPASPNTITDWKAVPDDYVLQPGEAVDPTAAVTSGPLRDPEGRYNYVLDNQAPRPRTSQEKASGPRVAVGKSATSSTVALRQGEQYGTPHAHSSDQFIFVLLGEVSVQYQGPPQRVLAMEGHVIAAGKTHVIAGAAPQSVFLNIFLG